MDVRIVGLRDATPRIAQFAEQPGGLAPELVAVLYPVKRSAFQRCRDEKRLRDSHQAQDLGLINWFASGHTGPK